MHTTLISCTLQGLDCLPVHVEVDISNGMPAFSIVGLGDTSVQESRERVRAAIKNSSAEFPLTRKTVNLAPADLKKRGPSFDLPIAIGLLHASGQIPLPTPTPLFIGELALNGDIRPITGIISIIEWARKEKIQEVFIPEKNLKEASLIPGITLRPARSLTQIIKHLKGEKVIPPVHTKRTELHPTKPTTTLDLSAIKGQAQAKRALFLAAAGRHNILLSGPPGSGKTCLAQALQSILPPLSREAALEVTKIYSLVGLIPPENPLITTPPFRSVHHSASVGALVGGGRHARPGEITLAHHGVLFIDEIAEFPPYIIDSLRQPLEEKRITISRANARHEYPANMMVIAAMNPCPCGFFTDLSKECTCTESQIHKYQQKLSGPFLDRIDLFVDLPRLSFKELSYNSSEKESPQTQKKVKEAHRIQAQRFKHSISSHNSHMTNDEIKHHCALTKDCKDLMKQAVEVMQLSPRAYFRTLKLARTIADTEAHTTVTREDLQEALIYRKIPYKI